MRCTEAGWYRWYRRAAAAIGIGGGCAMIVGAAASRNSASVPLLVIGSGWILVGVILAWQGRRFVREVVVAGGVARFISASACIDVPAVDVTEIGHAWCDFGRMGTLTVKTASHGKIKAMPRLEGFLGVLAELRRSNPGLVVRNG